MSDAVLVEAPPVVVHRTVARNASVYFVGQIASWIVTFAAFSVIPRRLGERNVGEMYTASSVVLLVWGLFSCGIDNYMTCETGRDRRRTEPILSAALGFRAAMALPMALCCILVFTMMRADALLWKLGFVFIGAYLISSFSESLRSILAGWERAREVTMTDMVTTLFTLGAIPVLGAGPIILPIAYGMSYITTLWLRQNWISREIRISPSWNVAEWKRVVHGGLPFAANGLILQVYGFIGVALVRHFMDVAAVGVFSQAQRLVGTFVFVPTALGAALLPALARLTESNPDEIKAQETRVVGLMVTLGLPMAVGIALLADPLCHLLYGADKFRDLPLALQCLSIGIVPIYLVITLYQFLVAQNKNGLWTRYLLATVAIFAILCCVLIPLGQRYFGNGVAGALLANALAELCGAVFALCLLRVQILGNGLLGRVLRTCLATMGMGVVLWATRRYFLPVPIVMGTITYVLLGGLLQILPPEEQARLTALVRRITRGRIGGIA